MALIKCKECGNEVSSEAKKCPNCGFPLKSKKKSGCLTLIIAIVLIIGFIGLYEKTIGHKSIFNEKNSDLTEREIPKEAIEASQKRSKERKPIKIESKVKIDKPGISHKVLGCYTEKDARSIYLALETADASFAKEQLLNESCLWIEKGTPHNVLEVKDTTSKVEFWLNGETYIILHVVLQKDLVKESN